MRKQLFAVLSCSVALMVSCSSGNEAVKRAPEADVQEEWVDEMMGEFGEQARQEVRKVSQEYVQSQMSDCVVEGMATTAFTGNLFLVGVDVSCAEVRKTLDLVARRFYPPDRLSSYWKVGPLTPEFGQALSGYAAKRLEREKRELGE